MRAPFTFYIPLEPREFESAAESLAQMVATVPRWRPHGFIYVKARTLFFSSRWVDIPCCRRKHPERCLS